VEAFNVNADLARRRSLASTSIVAALLGGVLAAAPAAVAGAGTGGTFSSFPPEVDAVECLRDCAGIDVARPGSLVRVTGDELATASTVIFSGGAGSADDAKAVVTAARRETLTVTVPAGARSGPVVVVSRDGLASEAKVTLAIDRAPLSGSGGGTAAIEARIATRTVLYGGQRKARLTYLLKSGAPTTLSVGLVRVKTGELVRTWQPGVVAPGTARTITWNGLDRGGRVAADGAYRFRVVAGADAGSTPVAGGAAPSGGARAAVADPSFTFLRHIYPVRGAHDYGTFINRFGGGRNHGGQDVLSPCGTPLVAARGGKVIVSGMESGGGGNTVVVDGVGTDLVYVYYHMRDTPLPKVGDTVWTGQVIGFVGSTGSSTACHLHFELHQGGQWYDDSRAFDPLPSLKAWDKLS
jgi:murein DD-endopeptidase MepM/ murein hydrolase activator NlpD